VNSETASGGAAGDLVVLRVAKTLQGSFSKQTAGEARKWRDVPPDEKKMWVRLARAAQKQIVEAL
jgi:hypothetical protein